MPRPSHALLATAAASAALSAPSAHAAVCDPGAPTPPNGTTVTQNRHAVRCILNASRERHRLRPLLPSPPLRRAATAQAHDMVAAGYFAHRSPDGSTLLRRITGTGYVHRGGPAWAAGEVIGWQSEGGPATMVRAWRHSPPHRAIILAAMFREVGIGIAPGTPRGGPGTTYVAVLGVRRR